MSTDRELDKENVVCVCVCVYAYTQIYIPIYVYTHTHTHNEMLLIHKNSRMKLCHLQQHG